MRRPLIAITAAAILGVACATSLGTSRLAVNPELVNPVVVTSSFASGALGPVNPPAGVPPTPPSEFWNAPSGLLPVLTSPPSEPPEIVMADVNQRMSILYVTDPGAKAILGSSTGMRELPWLFRQEPSNSRGEAALDWLGDHELLAADTRAGDARHTLAALRFAWEYLAERVPRERVAAAAARLLANPAVAADAAVDLARWRHWASVADVATLWDRLGRDDPLVRRAVAGYLTACPLESAASHAATIAAAAPEAWAAAVAAAALPPRAAD
jgi:hypothetical protein